MGDFFYGWQRKIGLVTLLMALALMGAWIRSLVFLDAISFRLDHHHFISIVSNNAAIEWVTIETTADDFGDFYENDDVQLDLWDGANVEWRWNWCGFDFGKGNYQPENDRFHLWGIPYWTITLTVTLLSAFLLLSSPKPIAQTQSDPSNHA